MSEETPASDAQPVVQSLDDVIAAYSPAAPQAPEPAAEPQIVAPVAPTTFDPLDENSVNQFVQQTAQSNTALHSELQSLNQKLDSIEQDKIRDQVEAEIKTAASEISEKAGIDKDYAEFQLEKKARENPGFQSIWDNRKQNPTAYKAALDAISNELVGKTDFKIDPQIAENHRAAQQSQQTGGSAPATEYNNPLEERLASAKTPEERQVIWSQIKAQG